MQRTLQPELLDSLPHDHPDALHNRRDLRIINRLLGTHHWFEHTLSTLLRPGETVLEVGAGTGELGARLHRRGLPVAGLDLWPRPVQWPDAGTWHQENLQTFGSYTSYSAVIGNLIFHQFSDSELTRLGNELRHTARVIVACEPERRRLSQIVYRIVGPLLGANHVSRHDAHVSIAAGFRGHELSRALGLGASEWKISHTSTPLGAYRMIAVRRT